jgi:ABC-2 type transport system permease protein
MRRVALLLRKDLLVLRRSPLLLGILLAYPLVTAALVGLVAGYANAKPRVALVDKEHLPPTVVIAGHRFDVQKTIRDASKHVRLVRLSEREAKRQLRNGRLVAVITVPRGLIEDLQTTVRSPALILETAKGGITPRVTQQMQALVYSLNTNLQKAYVKTNIEYVHLLLHGGTGMFLNRRFTVLGLDRTEHLLDQLPANPKVDRMKQFVHVARLALAETDDALRTTAHPIRLVEAPEHGRSWVLSAQVQAYALGLTLSFLTLMLAAGMLAAERDENAIGRLARGLASLGEVVGAKIALAAVVALGLGLAISLAFGVIIQIGNVRGGEPWSRFPLLLVGLCLAGASLGAVGAVIGGLAREARTASLVALLVVLPVIFVGLVPREVVPTAAYLSDALPFAHAVRFFNSALYDASPWASTLREAVWLIGLGLLFGVIARLGARRLLA